ncbi:uncharacterized protein LOC132035796 isoform X2 [Lycium ferocissimum]|uniref:uncharacterized protein LOC132035796 isoform X2 n=1 Tax=Lycium ferocissimum TaxID=112874 RepID=UPI0028160490|nr:uncharacterized protein LOC132035796 isoform X2 [Lycium ferocissimum]
MTQRLGIYAITPEIPDWTCKVQVVDICKPGESSHRKIKYLNMIFQDEQEDQIKAIVYGDDISSYQDIFKLFHTYLITGARIQVPNLRYERPLHTFEWIIDKKTIVDPIEKDSPDEDELPPPTKLNLTSFEDINNQAAQSTKEQLKDVEFNILAIVVRCFPPRFVPKVQRRLQEVILINTDKQAFTFTLWEETIIEDEGRKLLDQFQKRPIIFARRIGVSKYNGTSLTTRFNTTVQIDPPYSQCLQLHTWVIENREMLASFSLRSTSESGSLISVSVDEQIVPIANVQSQQDGHSFSIEAKVSLPNKLKSCYVLLCPKCKQEVRSLIKRKFLCMTCKQQNMLIPRCRFDVNLHDASGSIIGIIMDKEAEKLLSLTTDEIYDLASNENIQSKLNQNFYIIQVKKSFSHSSQATSGKLYILSCTEKGKMVHSLPESPKTDIEEGNKRKKKHLVSFDEETEVPTERRHSLKLKQKLEPTTPVKKK